MAMPLHLTEMLEKLEAEPRLELTASCGCKVHNVLHEGETLPLVSPCKDHLEDVLSATTPYTEKREYVN